MDVWKNDSPFQLGDFQFHGCRFHWNKEISLPQLHFVGPGRVNCLPFVLRHRCRTCWASSPRSVFWSQRALFPYIDEKCHLLAMTGPLYAGLFSFPNPCVSVHFPVEWKVRARFCGTQNSGLAPFVPTLKVCPETKGPYHLPGPELPPVPLCP